MWNVIPSKDLAGFRAWAAAHPRRLDTKDCKSRRAFVLTVTIQSVGAADLHLGVPLLVVPLSAVPLVRNRNCLRECLSALRAFSGTP